MSIQTWKWIFTADVRSDHHCQPHRQSSAWWRWPRPCLCVFVAALPSSPGADFQKVIRSKVYCIPCHHRFHNFSYCLVHKMIIFKHYPFKMCPTDAFLKFGKKVYAIITRKLRYQVIGVYHFISSWNLWWQGVQQNKLSKSAPALQMIFKATTHQSFWALAGVYDTFPVWHPRHDMSSNLDSLVSTVIFNESKTFRLQPDLRYKRHVSWGAVLMEDKALTASELSFAEYYKFHFMKWNEMKVRWFKMRSKTD